MSKLTEYQKTRLAKLEPELKRCAKLGKLGRAKSVTAEIQDILRPSGHETRLMKDKNWLFQAAFYAGDIEYARMGFEGVRRKTRKSTRAYLEATAFEAICFLRMGDMRSAEPLMAEALKRISNIASRKKREQFYVRMVDSFEQEWVLASLRNPQPAEFDVQLVQDEAGRLVHGLTDEEIEEYAADSVPQEVLDRLLDAYSFSRKQLPSADKPCLPDPSTRKTRAESGKTLMKSLRKVVWRSLCDEESDVYKMWFKHGLMYVLDKKVITASVIAAMADLSIGYIGLASAVTAIAIKTGIEVYCDRFEPLDLMIEPKDYR